MFGNLESSGMSLVKNSIRAVGLNSGQITRMYLYESFSVILSSMIIGFTIGIIIAVTSDLQTTLFLELPYHLIVLLMIKNVL